MKRTLIERNLVVVLFAVVLVVFSFAERDSKKFEEKFLTAAQIIKKATMASLESTATATKTPAASD